MYDINDWISEIGRSSTAPAAVAALYTVCQENLESTLVRRGNKEFKDPNTKVTELNNARDVLKTQQVKSSDTCLSSSTGICEQIRTVI